MNCCAFAACAVLIGGLVQRLQLMQLSLNGTYLYNKSIDKLRCGEIGSIRIADILVRDWLMSLARLLDVACRRYSTSARSWSIGRRST